MNTLLDAIDLATLPDTDLSDTIIDGLYDILQYTRYPSTARGSYLAVNDCTLDVQLTLDRPTTP